jgi:hypothetical protein
MEKHAEAGFVSSSGRLADILLVESPVLRSGLNWAIGFPIIAWLAQQLKV